ncbi:class I SAM-dependent methyltransferase [Caballeronia temeraria]|uniref:class I SAM-dependent methyltransferase n=1 Tax=Caballeronia temeraria TaxID=1777137 RepID=UPI001FC9049A|nr:class I SAM-dependent methyltransferase [Caballeronia temeraria]
MVDFSRGGADIGAGKKVDPYSGIPIYYYRCEQCGFAFTRAFDEWTSEDFGAHTYNADYVRQDPDYTFVRPDDNARQISEIFSALSTEKILDFGSGLGLFEQQLKARGFQNVRSYDPFSQQSDESALAERYRVVFTFEVFEHHTDPHQLVKSLASLLDESGSIVFSTLLLPANISDHGIESWWYCMPRNGHISFFTPASLTLLASCNGLKAASFNEGLHIFYKSEFPNWAAHVAREFWS